MTFGALGPASLQEGVPADTATALLSNVERLIAVEGAAPLLRAALLVLVGLPLAWVLSRWVQGWVGQRYSAQRGMVAGKLLLYLGIGVVLVSTLSELGFSLAPLLGAAGILGIALGFASQTSVSNIISGMFLMAEQPFVVDDVIQVDDLVGRVLSVDMMSVKLRTFDNRFVRIPNETIIKTRVTTVTRFPIRRLDLLVGVAYKEDVGRVRTILLEVADQNPLALMEPPPQVLFRGYGNSSIDLTFAVWATRENWLKLKNTLHEEVKARFDREGIEIPFPHSSVYAGLATEPFPIRLVSDSDGSPAAFPPGDAGADRAGGGGAPGGGEEEGSGRGPGEPEAPEEAPTRDASGADGRSPG